MLRMGDSATKQASVEDLLDLPENLVGEIINGSLHTHPRPAPKHARGYSSLGGNLWNPFDKGNDGPGGWWIIDAPALHLDGCCNDCGRERACYDSAMNYLQLILASIVLCLAAPQIGAWSLWLGLLLFVGTAATG